MSVARCSIGRQSTQAVVALGDLQRNHAVHRGPQGLRNQVGISQLVAEISGVDRLLHRQLQERIGIAFRIAFDFVIAFVELAPADAAS